MKYLFILGAGFSKGIFSSMPLTQEVSIAFDYDKELNKMPFSSLFYDPELLLTYLNTSHPWKSEEEILRDKSLFYRVQELISGYVGDCEADSFQKETIPEWAKQFLVFLNDSSSSVITFNYDTIIERIGLALRKEVKDFPNEKEMYDLPLATIYDRESATWAMDNDKPSNFSLIKLHGSLNWYYSGLDDFPGEHVYYIPIDSTGPFFDGWGNGNRTTDEITRLIKDKKILIIPPVSEKSLFYQNRTIRSLWSDAIRVLKQAEEIYCIGYSMPQTDITTRIFFRTIAKPKTVHIVNLKIDDTLVEKYKMAFPNAKIQTDFHGQNCIPELIEQLKSKKLDG